MKRTRNNPSQPQQPQETFQLKPNPNILSIDAGFTHLGWAVFSNDIPINVGVIGNRKVDNKITVVSNKYQIMASFMTRSLRDIYIENKCVAMIGELPHGGGKSSNAVAHMNMSTAIVGSVIALMDIPFEACTPSDVKIATFGKGDASKDDMMARIISIFDGTIDEKIVQVKKTKKNPKGFRRDRIFHLCGKEFHANNFEHIADACGAYLALVDGNLIKMFGGK